MSNMPKAVKKPKSVWFVFNQHGLAVKVSLTKPKISDLEKAIGYQIQKRDLE